MKSFELSQSRRRRKGYSRVVRDRICQLSRQLAGAEDTETFVRAMADFYREFGVGKFGLHKAFRIEHKKGERTLSPFPGSRTCAWRIWWG